MKLKHSNYDETQKLKWWKNAKTQMVTKLKNSNCDKTKKKSNFDKAQKLKLLLNSKNQIVTQLKLWKKSNCDKTKILTKLKNFKCDKIQIVTKLKLKLWQNAKTHIVKKLELWKILILEKLIKSVFKWEHLVTLITDEMFSGQRFAILAMFNIYHPPWINIYIICFTIPSLNNVVVTIWSTSHQFLKRKKYFLYQIIYISTKDPYMI